MGVMCWQWLYTVPKLSLAFNTAAVHLHTLQSLCITHLGLTRNCYCAFTVCLSVCVLLLLLLLLLVLLQEFLNPVRASSLVQQQGYHYVIDCIDSVAPKQALLLAGHTAGEGGLTCSHTSALYLSG